MSVPSAMRALQSAKVVHFVPPFETDTRLSRMVLPSVAPPCSAASAIKTTASYDSAAYE